MKKLTTQQLLGKLHNTCKEDSRAVQKKCLDDNSEKLKGQYWEKYYEVCKSEYTSLLTRCAKKSDEEKGLKWDYNKLHNNCPTITTYADIKLKEKNCPVPDRPGFDPNKWMKKVKPKAKHGESVAGDMCTLKKVVIGEEAWKIWNGFDVFQNDPKKYLGHIHGKYESNYFNQDKYSSCKTEEVEEEVVVEVKEEFKKCEWVDYQEWAGQLGCKTEKSKICIGKVACTVGEGEVKFHSVACSAVDRECPDAGACASDESLSSTDKSYTSDQYSTETKKVKAE